MPDNPSIIHSVSGTIFDRFNTPLAGVEIFDKGLSKEESIDSTKTVLKGFYNITYNPQNFPQAYNKPPSPDVFISVKDFLPVLVLSPTQNKVFIKKINKIF